MMLKKYLTLIGLPNIFIRPNGKVSKAFLSQNITTLWDAILHVQQLPYDRNTDRGNYELVLQEHKGTCSTKHAIIAALTEELEVPLQLMLGIFLVRSQNRPDIAPILEQHNLPAIPEAHCFLRYANYNLDITFSDAANFTLSASPEKETPISPNQIGQFKVLQHQKFIAEWVKDKPHISFELVWTAREQWIKALSTLKS